MEAVANTQEADLRGGRGGGEAYVAWTIISNGARVLALKL
jgi:hypothetical protein